MLAEQGQQLPAGDGAQPCDWAAFGLLGSLWDGVLIEHQDGSTTEAFNFAGDPPAEDPDGVGAPPGSGGGRGGTTAAICPGDRPA